MTRLKNSGPEIGGRVRRLLRYEADVAFRRRAATVLEYVDPQAGDRILDAGCGLGFYLHILGRLSEATVFGVELDGKRLAAGLADPFVRRALVARGDVARLPFRDASFDKLIISEVLEHVPDDVAVIAEVARVLKPGGVCAVTVPHAGYPMLWDPLNYVRERLGRGHFETEPLAGIWTDHFRLYRREDVLFRVEEAGLEVSDIHLETRYSFPFSHHLIYGLGKLLVEKNLVGRAASGNASRFTFWGDDGPHPGVKLLVQAFSAFDGLNQPRYDEGPAVNICLRATKPR